MKKKILIICLIAALLILSTAPALALRANPFTPMTYGTGDNALFIGANNYIYHIDSSHPLVEQEARSIVYADGVKLLLTTVDLENADGAEEPVLLYSLALTVGDAEPVLVSNCATDCVYVPGDGAVYFVSADSRNVLMSYNVVAGSIAEAVDAGAPIVELQQSVDGLLVELEDATMLYVPQIAQLVESNIVIKGQTIVPFGQIETILDANGKLSIRSIGQKSGQLIHVDDNVLCATALNGIVYYVFDAADGITLKSYNYSTGGKLSIGRFNSALLPDMDSDGNYVYLMAGDGRIFQMSDDSNSVSVFDKIPSGVELPIIHSTSDRVIIYDGSSVDGVLKYVKEYPLFVEPEDEEEAPEVDVIEPDDEEEEEEPVATARPTPAPTPAPWVLTKGSRGDTVLELQQLLKDNNYPVGTPDGIYGSRTVDAVKYLQYDMGDDETGKVTEAFYKRLKKSMPTYERFVKMKKGDNGIRVYDLQVKLKQLRFLDAAANGSFGPKTVDAVKAYQKLARFTVTGTADTKTTKHMWSKNAIINPDYPEPTKAPSPTARPDTQGRDPSVTEADLVTLRDWMNSKFGTTYDKHDAVFTLQNRLYELGYLKKNQRTKVYTTATVNALKKYQKDYDLAKNPKGIAGVKILDFMFTKLF